MKRVYLFAACTLAFMLLAGNAMLMAQQPATPSEPSKVVIIQKSTDDDGAVIIKKKRIEKGQDLDSYLEALELESSGDNVEVIVVTDEEGVETKEKFDGETVFFFRQSKDGHEFKSCDKIKHHEKMVQGLERMHIMVPSQEMMQHQEFVFQNNFNFDQHAVVAYTNDEKRTFLGVTSEDGEDGLHLTGIVSGSGAESAGLQEGDVMTSIAGQAIRTTGDLRNVLAKHEAGDAVAINYLRNGQPMQTTAELTEKKNDYTYAYNYNYWERDPCKPFIGVYVGSWGQGEQGVGVVGIVPNTGAERAGLQDGDRILALDNIPVNTHNELVTERDRHNAGDYYLITYLRNGVKGEVTAQFKECPKEQPAQPAQPEQPQIVEEPVPAPAPPAPPVEFNDNTLQFEELSAFPNPTYGNVNIRFEGEAVPTTFTITDVNGRVVFKDNQPNFDGLYNKQADVSSGVPGNLTLTVRQGDKVVSKQVVLLNRA